MPAVKERLIVVVVDLKKRSWMLKKIILFCLFEGEDKALLPSAPDGQAADPPQTVAGVPVPQPGGRKSPCRSPAR